MCQYNPFSLEGKIILVTGASSGIGRATAIECAKMGASLVITGRDEERLKETFVELEVSKNRVHMQIVADLSTEDGIKIWFARFLLLMAVLVMQGLLD